MVALAIGVHNVPEGMAVATVLAAKGVSPRECALWAAVTSAPQALLAAHLEALAGPADLELDARLFVPARVLAFEEMAEKALLQFAVVFRLCFGAHV